MTGTLLTEPYVLIRPADQPDTRRLPLLKWDENCNSATHDWFRTQDWLPAATTQVADDTVLMSMVSHGLGMAVVPALTAARLPESVAVQQLDGVAPTRTIGYLTTVEMARSSVVRALIRQLRAIPKPRLGSVEEALSPHDRVPR